MNAGKEIIGGHHVEQEIFQEIGDTANYPETVIYERVNYALTKLREEIGNVGAIPIKNEREIPRERHKIPVLVDHHGSQNDSKTWGNILINRKNKRLL